MNSNSKVLTEAQNTNLLVCNRYSVAEEYSGFQLGGATHTCVEKMGTPMGTYLIILTDNSGG